MSTRLFVRDAYAAVLSVIPLRWLNSIRFGYQTAPPGSLRQKAAEAALRCLRYRRLDASVPMFSPADRPDICFSNVESVIARRIFWLGQSGYEGDESRCWEFFCSRAEAIVEIGANIGMYTVLGAKAAGQTPYAAVEPHPQTLEVLRKNVVLNNLSNVQIVPAAVVGRKECNSMTLAIPEADPDATPAGAYLSSGGEGRRDLAQTPRYPVDVIEAREIIDGADLIKLDVEGYEYEILSSLRAYVKERRPTIFIEVRDQTPRLRNLLREWVSLLGYQCYVPSHKGIVKLTAADLPDLRLEKTYGARDVILSAEPPFEMRTPRPVVSSTALTATFETDSLARR